MSSTFSAESAASVSDLNGLECEPSPSAKSIPSADECSLVTGQLSLSGMTLNELIAWNVMSSVQDSPARMPVLHKPNGENVSPQLKANPMLESMQTLADAMRKMAFSNRTSGIDLAYFAMAEMHARSIHTGMDPIEKARADALLVDAGVLRRFRK